MSHLKTWGEWQWENVDKHLITIDRHNREGIPLIAVFSYGNKIIKHNCEAGAGISRDWILLWIEDWTVRRCSAKHHAFQYHSIQVLFRTQMLKRWSETSRWFQKCYFTSTFLKATSELINPWIKQSFTLAAPGIQPYVGGALRKSSGDLKQQIFQEELLLTLQFISMKSCSCSC